MPMTQEPISAMTVERLSIYLRTLRQAKEEGKKFISSTEIANKNGITSAQVRKDLSFFGSFGKKGLGYNIDSLLDSINKILGLNHRWKVALIGLGHLGEALVRHKGFQKSGFDVTAIFDIAPSKVGRKYHGIEIFHIDQFAKKVIESGIEIAIIAVPSHAARETVERVIKAGVRGILNFTDVSVPAPDGIVIKNVSIASELETITFYLARDTGKT